MLLRANGGYRRRSEAEPGEGIKKKKNRFSFKDFLRLKAET